LFVLSADFPVLERKDYRETHMWKPVHISGVRSSCKAEISLDCYLELDAIISEVPDVILRMLHCPQLKVQNTQLHSTIEPWQARRRKFFLNTNGSLSEHVFQKTSCDAATFSTAIPSGVKATGRSALSASRGSGPHKKHSPHLFFGQHEISFWSVPRCYRRLPSKHES
jgi:hypothetical protein